MGVEEPENQLHPRLLPVLASECRAATSRSQLLVTTHSPYFVDGVRAKELWVLYRGDDGYARARRASDMPKVDAFMTEGAQLGDLWMEGYFDVGDPLVAAGGPATPLSGPLGPATPLRGPLGPATPLRGPLGPRDGL